jgi:hypothetical protein
MSSLVSSLPKSLIVLTKVEDGKEMKLNLKELRITEIVDTLDRHSRQLARAEDLQA